MICARSMRVTITQEEMDRVTELYDALQATPLISLDLSRGTLTDRPRKELRNYLGSLGRKYGYKPETAVIATECLHFEAEPVE